MESDLSVFDRLTVAITQTKPWLPAEEHRKLMMDAANEIVALQNEIAWERICRDGS